VCSAAPTVPSAARALSLLRFSCFLRWAFDQVAALDPKYEFTFAPGAPTVGDLNAAAGAPLLTVAAVHYLHVASGGALRAAPGAANRFIVPWTDVDIAMLKVHNQDAAFHGTPSAGRITNLRAMHDAFQRAAAGGLTFRHSRLRRGRPRSVCPGQSRACNAVAHRLGIGCRQFPGIACISQRRCRPAARG